MTNKLGAFATGISSEKQNKDWLDLAPYEHRPVTSAMLRGGRMIKQHGVAASYSPELGVSVAVDGAAGGETSLLGRALAALRWGVAPAAIAASGLVGASPALAQDACVETAPGSGVFVCEDNGAPAITQQTIVANSVDITIEDGFAVDTTGIGGDGLDITSNGGNISIRQSDGTSSITGDQGIRAVAFPVFSASLRASALVSITTGGSVTGRSSVGIFARTPNLGVAIDSTAGPVTGAINGILINSYGVNGTDPAATRGVSITTADVNSGAGDAINVYNGSNGDGIVIDTTQGQLTAGGRGIYARARNDSASIEITTANVSSTSSDAIYVRDVRGDLTIDTTAGALTADGSGINARGFGYHGANVRITTGDITSVTDLNGRGIYTRSNGQSMAIDSSAGRIEAYLVGVSAAQSGPGTLVITTGDVAATGINGSGINAATFRGSGLSIDSSGGSITSANLGIRATKTGYGDLDITTADVESTRFDAISGENNSGNAFNIDTSAGTISGGRHGILAYNRGAGDLTITVNDVSGSGGNGIRASSTISVADIVVRGSSGDVVGASDGIYLRTSGADILVENLDSVTGNAGDGLDLGSAGGAITVSDIGTITANGGAGIVADSQGGAIAISDIDTINGAVAAISRGGDISIQGVGQVGGVANGISAGARSFGIGSGGNIEIGNTTAIGDVTSTYGPGIAASTDGLGTVTIDSSGGTVTSAGRGIDVNLGSGDGAISITTGDVDARFEGVYVRSNGAAADAVAIDTSGGSISSVYSVGIYLNSSFSDVSIVTGDVTGSTFGIRSRSYAGDVFVDTSEGTVSGITTGVYVGHSAITGSTTVITGATSGTSRYGTFAFTGGDGLTVDTSAGSAYGGTWAVVAINNGSGATIVNTADATGAIRDGVFVAANGGLGTDVSVDTSAGTVTGLYDGIDSYNGGTGSHTIITADVAGTNFAGIFAQNSTLGTDFTVNSSAGSVIGGNDGIDLDQYGSGALTITTASVTGTVGDGIDARSYGTDLTIDSSAGVVEGATNGIYAQDFGSGTLTITTGDVTGNLLAGVRARKTAGTDLIIDTSAGSVSGVNTGINASLDYGTGSVSITTGAVTATSGMGVFVTNSTYGTDLLIDTAGGPVIGNMSGVYARNDGTGITSVITADVTGQAFDGVDVRSQGTDVTVDTSAGTVTGQQSGVSVQHQGSGYADITTGDVTGNYAVGVAVSAFGSGVSVDTSAGSVVGGNNGLSISNYGYGPTSITTANVTGSGFYGILVNSGAGDVTIDSSAGSVSGANTGIRVRQYGYGAVSITSADVTGTNNYGIDVFTVGDGVTIDTIAGTVTGGLSGISVRNSGYGSASITTASVEGYGQYGITATSYGTAGDLTIDSSAGAVTGNTTGIQARQYGAGALSITSGGVSGNYGRGIYGYLGGASASNLTIDSSAGTVEGANGGIAAVNFGLGDASITTATVIAAYNSGIDLDSFGTDASIDSSAGAVRGTYGIDARNYGTGALTITTADVDGTVNDGIFASNDGTDLVIDSSAGTVTGSNRGIAARSYGYYSNDLSITTGRVVGQASDAIYAVQYGANGNLTIDSSGGAAIGATNGIFARNYGAGNLAITTADATGANGYGIIATQYGGDELMIDSTAGLVNGSGGGIFARNFGNGALTISSADVAGDGTVGIVGRGYGTDVSIDSSAGSVIGQFDGIEARNEGSGALTLTTANVTGTFDDGIYAFNTGTDLIIDTSAGAVSGSYEGIDARNFGSGILSITSADISATSFDGIFANNYGTDLIIDTTAGTINASRLGVFANHRGTGSLNIATADVNSTYNFGVYGGTGYAATEFGIDTSAGHVTADSTGILARHRGTGSLSITSADVTSVNGTAIYGFNSTMGTDLTVDSSAGSVNAPVYGIDARQSGNGALNVTTADVASATSRAIRATNSAAGTDLVIDSSAGSVSAASEGIFADNDGTGALSVTTADVASQNDNAIVARNSANGTDLTIDSSAGGVRGNNNGIFADNRGSGVLSVLSGDVTADTLNGIFTANYGSNLLVDSTAGSVSGVNSGIFVIDNGSGTGTIRTADVTASDGNAITGSFGATGTDVLIDTSSGTVTGSNIGINGSNSGAGSTTLITADVIATGFNAISFTAFGTDFSVDTTAGQVAGQTEGVRAINMGSGVLSVTTGDVTGLTDRGIFLLNDGSDTMVDTSAGSVTGGTDGINVSHSGSGDLSIVTADVSGLGRNGISVSGAGTGLSLDSSAGTVVGDARGIFASHRGSGAVSITAADVTGVGGDGMLILNSTNGTDLTVDTSAGSVSGEYDGVEVINYGTGATSVITGTVSANTDDAVYARGDGMSLTVDTSAGAITGGTEGIVALNNGTGALSIVSADAVGDSGDGIYAVNSADGTTLNLDSSAGSVTGALQGIDARHYGSGALTVTVNDVVGLGGEAIRAISTQMSASVTVQGSSGDVTGATDGIAVVTAGADIAVDNLDSVIGLAGDGLDLTSAGGAITVSDIGAITGMGANGILADSDGGAITIDGVGLSGGVTGTAGAGILADASGGMGGSILIGSTTAIGDVMGSTNGIKVITDGAGSIAIDSSAGTVIGGESGIDATDTGSGAVAITTADAIGMTNAGILARTSGSSLSIDSSAGTVTGAIGGILAGNTGSGATTITAADTVSTAGIGIFAQTSGTDLIIDSSAGSVMGADDGIVAENTGTGVTAITAADVTGMVDAIAVAAAGTDVSVDSTAGTVAGGNVGVLVDHTGTGSVSISTAMVAGVSGYGIVAEASGTDLVIDTSAGVVEGGLGGIDADNTGSGATTITTGDVTGRADEGIEVVHSGTDLTIDTSAGTVVGGAIGIVADNTGSGSTVITAGDIRGGILVAIDAVNGMGTSGLTINLTGITMGETAGVLAANDGTGPTTVVNDGTLMATSGEAINVSGADAEIANNGTLLGFVTLGDGDDTLTNNGMFMAEGDSSFGLGADLLTNNGDFAVASGGSLTLGGLESFANTGLVSLVDDAIGNNLILAGDFAGSGGSMLGLDVDFAAASADVLTIGGAVTGSTTLGINTVGGTPTTLFADILVVDAGSGSAEAAFTLAGGRQTLGLIEFDVVFDASSNDYLLATAPSQAAFQAGNFAESARGVWQQSADAFSGQMATDRDQFGSGSSSLAGGQDSSARAWLTGFGGDIDRDRDLSSNVNGITNQFDLGYDQDSFGVLAGVDFGSETLRYGITGGYLSSEVRFAASPNRIDFDVLTIGAYLALDTGPFFANALLKYDNINGQLSSATGGVSSELDGSAFGVQGEVGALLGDRTGFFFEPSASLAYNHADLNGVTTAQGNLTFEEGDSMLGKIGARLGSGFQSGDTPGAIYVGARYVHEFEGEDSVIFTSGGQTASFGNLPVDDYAELTAGVSLGGEDDALSGGFRGQVLVGDDISGFGVSANIRFRF
ncbi:hypothetical protein [uncultured Erythrobacter sp.]|uniref:hypothetical protein n=1 Tax=uncultured Erythrobacter sp. TaxID=263913 RepID=UPI002622A97A|nr:hypothetical protein [uncultured Erythrobacter sp.]